MEHKQILYMVFIDLKKAYDSVPREALWTALQKYGFPPNMIHLIRSFHEGMSAELKVNGEILEGEIHVTNGLRQGCTMAPTLFSLFYNLVIEVWRNMCVEDGVTILYSMDGHLIGSRTSRYDMASWNELQFADDTAILGPSREKILHAMRKLFLVTSQWGLTISIPKTKAMVVGGTEGEQQDLQVDSVMVEMVQEFKYLGSVLHYQGKVEEDIKERVAKASQAFVRLKKSVFHNKDLTVCTKRVVYKAVILGTLLYGSETWTTKRISNQMLETFHNRCLRGIFGIARTQQRDKRTSSSQIREMFGMKEQVAEMVVLRRLRWLGHVARMSDSRMPKQSLLGRLRKTRPFHGVKMRWKDRMKRDMSSLFISSGWYNLAQDRKGWYDLCHGKMDVKIRDRLDRRDMPAGMHLQPLLPLCVNSVTEVLGDQVTSQGTNVGVEGAGDVEQTKINHPDHLAHGQVPCSVSTVAGDLEDRVTSRGTSAKVEVAGRQK